MSKFVNVASMLFEQEHLCDHPDAGNLVFNETRQRLDDLKGLKLDLVVLSEGVEAVGQKIEDAEELTKPGRYLKLYADFAVSEKCHVAGSLKVREGTKVYNSIVFIDPKGKPVGAYHKNNLTIGEIECGLSPGKDACVVDTAIGRIGGAICFDLNFEYLRKKYVALKPDIMIFSSMFHGGFVQRIWAYECRAFLVAALQIHGGGILDPLGTIISLTDCYNKTAIARINLDRAIVHLDYNRDKFQEIIRKYGDDIKICIPENLGSAIVYSKTDKMTAKHIVSEFELELLDTYLARAEKVNSEKRSI